MGLALDTGTPAKNTTWSGTTSGTITLTTNAAGIVVVCVAVEKTVPRPSVQSVTASGLTFVKRATADVTGASPATEVTEWWAYSSAALTGKVITVTTDNAVDDGTIIGFGVTGASPSAPWDINGALPAIQVYPTANSTPQVNVTTSAANVMVIMTVGAMASSFPGTNSNLFTTIDAGTNSGGTLFSSLKVSYKIFSSALAAVSEGFAGVSGQWGLSGDAMAEASTAASLTIDPGTFTLTGQSVGLPRGLHLGVGVGTFTLSGQAVNLLKGPHVAVGAGAFTLSGQAVTLRVGKSLAIGTGAFTLSGQAVTLSAGKHLAVGTGAFSLSGQAVGLEKGPHLAVGTGVFALTGNDVAMSSAHNSALTVGTGSFTLSGQAVGLTSQRKLAIAAGAFVLSGQNVSLKAAHELVVGAGAFTLTGQGVGLAAQRRMGVGTGDFLLTGQDAALTVRRLPIGAGAFVLTGQDIGFFTGTTAIDADKQQFLRMKSTDLTFFPARSTDVYIRVD